MKKKLLSGLLAITMALTPIGVAGAEFTDGNMTEKTNEILAGEETFFDKDTSTEAEPFTDSEVLSEEESVAVEDMNIPAAHAQNLYQVSVSGELILSETQKFVKLLNAERAKLGVPPVRLDKEMMEKAKERAIQGSIAYGHNAPDGTYQYLRPEYGECASIKWERDAEAFFDGWKNSPGHWKILSAPQNTRFGFAVLMRKDKHTPFGLTSHYGYTASGRDTDIHSFNPYSGDFKNQKINNYQINILDKYLDMIGENANTKVGNNLSLKPTYKVYDTVSDNNRPEYEFGYGTLNNKDGVWESDNPSVASVDDDGLVKAHKSGTAKIRFYVNGDRDKYYENIITVKSQPTKLKTPVVTGVPYKYSQVKLTWEKEEGRFIGYQIYKYNNSSKKYELYAKPEGNITTGGYSCKFGDKITFTDKNGYGKTVKYKIRTYRTDLDSEKTFFSSYSDIITVKTAPAATTITKATAGNGSVSLTWKKAAGAEYYQIYRAASKSGTYSKVKTVKGNVLTYKNTGLKRGKNYYYKVRSYRVQPDGKKVYSKFSPVIGKKTK